MPPTAHVLAMSSNVLTGSVPVGDVPVEMVVLDLEVADLDSLDDPSHIQIAFASEEIPAVCADLVRVAAPVPSTESQLAHLNTQEIHLP